MTLARASKRRKQASLITALASELSAKVAKEIHKTDPTSVLLPQCDITAATRWFRCCWLPTCNMSSASCDKCGLYYRAFRGTLHAWTRITSMEAAKSEAVSRTADSTSRMPWRMRSVQAFNLAGHSATPSNMRRPRSPAHTKQKECPSWTR